VGFDVKASAANHIRLPPQQSAAPELLRDCLFFTNITAASILAQLPRCYATCYAPDAADGLRQSASSPPPPPQAVEPKAGPSSTTTTATSPSIDCPVCLEPAQQPVMCGCGHTFCLACVRLTQTCPVCRKEHGHTFARLGTGDVLHLAKPKTPATLPVLLYRAVRDLLWYLALLVMVLPFLLGVFVLGFLWMLVREATDLMMGRKIDFPAPLRYQRWPRLAPHGISTTPPPWSFPALWEPDPDAVDAHLAATPVEVM
jgi:hypothetical protein